LRHQGDTVLARQLGGRMARRLHEVGAGIRLEIVGNVPAAVTAVAA
jgi:hypothetical protein